MGQWSVTPESLKMAWKMIDTVFPRYPIPARERNALLTIITQVALDDLLHSGSVRWTQALPSQQILVFDGNVVRLRSAEKTRLALKADPSPEEIDHALEWVEDLFDQHELSEDERATLFTALPCVGLEGLTPHLEWLKEPPFPELG